MRRREERINRGQRRLEDKQGKGWERGGWGGKEREKGKYKKNREKIIKERYNL